MFFEGPDDRMIADANRWLKLKSLVGDVRDGGGGNKVSIYWDDATMTPIISINKREYFVERGSIDSVIDSIPDPKVE